MSLTIKRAKTETVTLRLDPKTKFMLDYMARVQGRSITAIVEHAIRHAADNVGVPDEFNGVRTWSHFWDASEGVRMLQLVADSKYPTNFEEDELLAFARAHWEFFYTSVAGKTVRRAYADILWPKIDEYLDIWREQRRADYWAAGKAMLRDLSVAKLDAPTWPRGSKVEASLDDEIPF